MPAATWTIERTDQKFHYAQIHLNELATYVHRDANDDWAQSAQADEAMTHARACSRGLFTRDAK
jgi:hypothetical protein